MNHRGGGVRRVILLTLGWEDLPKAWSVHGTPPEERLVEPVPAVLVEVDGGWILLETGFNPARIKRLEQRMSLESPNSIVEP